MIKEGFPVLCAKRSFVYCTLCWRHPYLASSDDTFSRKLSLIILSTPRPKLPPPCGTHATSQLHVYSYFHPQHPAQAWHTGLLEARRIKTLLDYFVPKKLSTNPAAHSKGLNPENRFSISTKDPRSSEVSLAFHKAG